MIKTFYEQWHYKNADTNTGLYSVSDQLCQANKNEIKKIVIFEKFQQLSWKSCDLIQSHVEKYTFSPHP